ncbi:LPS export ABC transporter permease LptF [Niveibacterium sp. SC-1]|uniref:LPS export ABC transporter permease LptF n=1 Tax=Niveibacterium sp. SC-1 TaxID=3135646 RepID=UPI00311D8E16
MVFQRAAMREFAANAAAIFIALFFILVTVVLIRLLSQAAGGRLPADAVLLLIGFTVLNHTSTLLALTLFMAVLVSMGRMYRDSEMVVWFASGLPLRAWVWPVLRFALPMVVAIAALSTYLSPWAQSRAQTFRHELEARDDVSRVAPGMFREASSGNRTFFVESVAENSAEVKNVFIASRNEGRMSVIVANKGFVERQPNGDRFAVLLNGRQYDGKPGSPDFRVTQFERYGIRIEAREVGMLELTPRITPTPTLLALPIPSNLGELSWRIGLPLAALLLSLMAIPLAYVNPRAGSASNMIFAVFLFALYFNALGISQSSISQGKVGFWLGAFGIHLLMLVLLFGLFAYRGAWFTRLFRR